MPGSALVVIIILLSRLDPTLEVLGMPVGVLAVIILVSRLYPTLRVSLTAGR